MATHTQQRILDVAEELFATKGISDTSLRAITRAAKVNVAAIHYHFGSKEALLDAVIGRRAAPVNEAWRKSIEALEASAEAATVEAILGTFLEPLVRSSAETRGQGRPVARLFARVHAQPPEVVEALHRKHFGAMVRRYLEALQEALPDVPRAEVTERFRFLLGVLVHVFSGNTGLDVIPGHPPEPGEDAPLLRRLTTFLTAGLEAAGPIPGSDS